jgi:hypothetical protein
VQRRAVGGRAKGVKVTTTPTGISTPYCRTLIDLGIDILHPHRGKGRHEALGGQESYGPQLTIHGGWT